MIIIEDDRLNEIRPKRDKKEKAGITNKHKFFKNFDEQVPLTQPDIDN